MRLPRLPRRPGQGSIAGFAARLRFGLALAAVLLVFFAAGLYLFFPAAALKERLEHEIAARTGARARLEQLSLLFPPGLAGRRLTIQPAAPGWPTLEFSALTLKPRWRTLWRDPGLAVRAELPGGEVAGNLQRSGAVEMRLVQVPFAAPLPGPLKLGVSGTATAGSFAGTLPLNPAAETRLDLTLGDVRISGLESLGAGTAPLALGTVTLRGGGKGNALRIDQVAATGGQLEVSGSGTLLLATPLSRSRVNLDLALRPRAGLDPGLADLFPLLGEAGADGAYRLRLAGTLASPSLR